MKKIYIKRVIHRDRCRYAIVFDCDPELNAIARTIKEAQFSNTNKFWYADETEETLREILRAFHDKADIDISAISLKSNLPEPDKVSGDPDYEENIPRTIIKLVPEDKKEDDHVSLRMRNAIRKPGDRSWYGPVEFRIDGRDGRLSIRFAGYYDREWIDEIRSYGKSYYDKVHREFLLPWSKLTVDSLSDYFSSRGVEVRVIKPEVKEKIKESRRHIGDEVRSRDLRPEGYEGLELLRKYLEENRYSYRTVESYLALLELFFKFHNEKDPADITQDELSDFMNGFIIKNGFSASYQNQMVSTIKTFYEVSGKGRIIPQILERPRRGRSLPKVFSKDEVGRILNSTRNNKHKLLLWIIYSCGLRRSEVTNIRLTDLDRTRSILHIREGKGGVDRIVPVSDKVWKKVDEYLEGYRPGKYLFEGQNGERYSSESVYNVFKQALRKAGIKKDVGVHSLRHSYATHLHENGLDIRYIQELLGHKSTRTTEIYTHVSRRNLVAVRSPIEDLDLK